MILSGQINTPDDMPSQVCRETMAARFAWALGIDSASPAALQEAADVDALCDVTVMAALLGSPAEFADFLRDDDASVYDVAEVLGDDWAGPVLARLAGVAAWPEGLAA